MKRLLLFLFRYRAFLFFVFLEFICGWLLISNNRYQNAVYLNTSNRLVAGMLSVNRNVTDYFRLRKINQELAEQNSVLVDEIEYLRKKKVFELITGSLDTLLLNQYDFVTAKVINNSANNTRNYITINKGSRDGVAPGMGVISGDGVVGKVKYVSPYYAVITSLLHSDFMISSKIIDRVDLCTTQWDGSDPAEAQLMFVPRHIGLEEGDPVVTSGNNGVFPENIPIGRLKSARIGDNATFYEARIELSNDFRNLAYVFVVRNELKVQKDSIENVIRINDL